ncbi:BglG family transcription antiterminator [Mammaliicoccus fleurettii]|uniref:BglG family transcription antiterminator n=1 Tax=Mammaliicoccus fleurettii TaxID=150056 RepID=UPI002DB6EDD5|nr:BglG family transcription antiterminator [Mammaliicoccus fleurettii]MEB7725603.1 BglG family transcription antiterminator [Mammaliicoccus fleurettii]MEB7781209.1 BglG family transcription antiterminator [Mammaliicoccus fleurettii]
METRHLNIVKILYQHQHEYMNSDAIAKLLGLSSKTIRSHIKFINEASNDFGFSILIKKSKGYQLHIIDEGLFNYFLNERFLKDENLNFNNQDSRIRYIMKKLLLDDHYTKLESLSESMFVSVGTLKNDLNEMRKILSQYEIEIVSRPNYGMKIIGKEFQIRYAIAQFLLNNQHVNIGFTEDDIKSVKSYLIKLLSKYKIEIPEVKLDNLVTHINIAIVRIRNELMIEQQFQIEEQQLPNKLKSFFEEMIHFIEYRFELILPKKEMDYLYIHFVTTGIMNEVRNIPRNKMIETMIKHMLDHIKRIFYLDLTSDNNLKKNLYLHLCTSINRYKYKMNIRNPMLNEIKQNYPFAFDLGLVASKMIEKDLKVQISESEIGYLALHFEMALNRIETDKGKLNVILVCNSGLTSSQLIKYKLMQNFSNQIQISEIVELYNIHNADLEQADLIISTVPINDNVDLPILYVNPIMSQQDLDKIQKFIDLKDTHHLDELIEIIELKTKLDNKEDLLKYLNVQLEKKDLIYSGFIDSVKEREHHASTAYGNLVAIPHPVMPLAKQTFIYMITMDKPIAWDDKEVQIIFCLGLKKNTTINLERMYQNLTDIINDYNKVLNLIGSSSKEEFYKVFSPQLGQ